jgi:hypothetical protein
VYASNAVGEYSTNTSSFVVDMDRRYYDTFDDNSSFAFPGNAFGDVTWAVGNISFSGSGSSDYDSFVDSLVPFARLPLSGDEVDVYGNWSSDDGTDPSWVSSIVSSSSYAQSGDYDGSTMLMMALLILLLCLCGLMLMLLILLMLMVLLFMSRVVILIVLMLICIMILVL